MRWRRRQARLQVPWASAALHLTPLSVRAWSAQL